MTHRSSRGAAADPALVDVDGRGVRARGAIDRTDGRARPPIAEASRHSDSVRAGRASARTSTAPVTSPTPQVRDIAISLEPFTTVPGGPLAIAAPDDGTGRLFVAAQDGRIWVVEHDGTVLAEPMLDISRIISSGGERGLLGIAVHPAFPTDPRVFLSYTNPDGDSIVASVNLDPGDPDRLDLDTLKPILFVEQPFPNHNGGSVQFGPDGMLYLSFGDGGGGGDPQGNGQDLETLLGKILRIDIDNPPGGGAYRIPRGQPVRDGRRPARDLALGHAQPVADVSSTGPRVTCGSATSARARGRRSTSRARASVG